MFGPFRLDPEAEILFKGTEPVALGRRAVALLRILAERPGEPVSKDELIEAAWTGVVVEEANLTVQIAALRRVLGEEPGGERWIETLPRHGYRFVGPLETKGTGDPAPRIDVAPALALPDRPSIAVLPFANLSADPEQEYFADGIVEEIITALSRMRWLFVIARNSSFTFKGSIVDVRQIGRDLGVRYVLGGSVRKAGTQVRITARLIDASSGVHLWADRFDGSLDDIFDLQDEITASLVGAIAPKLQQAEIERIRSKPTESLDAYDLFLRGTASLHLWTPPGINAALELFYKAMERDPDFVTAHGMAAWCYVWRQVNGWTTDRSYELAEIVRLARRVSEFGKDDAVALSFGGLALGYVAGDLEGGVALVDRALKLNPNLSAAWHASGWVRSFLCETEVALEHLARAIRLSPLDPLMFSMLQVTALAHFIAGHYVEALTWAERAFRHQSNSLATIRLMAASNAMSGRLAEAQRAIARCQALDPDLRLSNLKDRVGPYRPEDFERYVMGLRIAGLPA